MGHVPRSQCKSGAFHHENTGLSTGVFVVAPPREIWNDVFSEITRLSDELEKLGFDIVMESDNA